jgi:hypothetical protein
MVKAKVRGNYCNILCYMAQSDGNVLPFILIKTMQKLFGVGSFMIRL